ncbi:MAG: aspartate-semialdehyde dehydrogenase [Coriobacteriales bacterium]|jgi:aspartate-semialdehyde dehydrogenase|nr:aspartate-semialdehyde dehydrogenase [Coriobacteriales bacterium]
MSKPLPQRPVIAVCGATGAVGREMLKVLEQRDFPATQVRALASARSAGSNLAFKGGTLEVEEMTEASFVGVDIALFSAGNAISERFRPAVLDAGAVMIDNSSAFRMEEGVPLVIPEVNPEDAFAHQGIIANPNCSTIQMVIVLDQLAKLAPLKRVVCSTYQAASGAGAGAMQELYDQSQEFLDGKPLTIEHFSHQIAFNCIPQIDVFLKDGDTKEEWKMVVETRKIMHQPRLALAMTCVRVPVLRCHAESVNVEFESAFDLEQARQALAAAPGIQVMDDPATLNYPMPGLLQGTDDIYVGRLRDDPSVAYGLQFWCVGDQLRKGAALNAVQIAELLINPRCSC